MIAKRFISLGTDLVCVLFVISGLIVQFGLQVFLGEDPVISSLNELELYIAVSLTVLFGAMLFIRYRRGYQGKGLVVFFALLILFFWCIQAADMIFNKRPVCLMLVRSLGLFTTGLVVAYGAFRIYREEERGV